MRALITIFCLIGAAQAYDNVSIATGPSGDPAWEAACGLPRVDPGGASQVRACDPLLEDCFSRVTIPAGEFPKAKCSDGTPGVFYVRPGVGASADKWVVHVQGGGSCRTHGDCLDRWCGRQGSVPYSPNKMSSDWDQDGVGDLPLNGKVGGMSNFAAGNDFADWTHVWMYYCSSDSWLGRASDVDYADPTGLLDFSVHHRGHTILYAARRMLRQRSAAWTADDGVVVPDLDSATEILFTGTSAGGKGALQNVDWFLRPLSAPRKAFVLDANMGATDTAVLDADIWVDTDADGIGDELFYSYRIDYTVDSWTSGWHAAVNAFVDQSCRAIYEPLGRLDRCSLMGPLLTLKYGAVPLIETETFIRLDLEDGVVSKQYTNTWPNGERLQVGQFGRVTTRDDFTQLMHASLEQLADDPSNGVTGVFGPRCAQHVGLETDTAYDDHNTSDSLFSLLAGWLSIGPSYTADEAIDAWYAAPGTTFRALDTYDVGDPAATTNVATDPALQFSAGTGCRY